MTFEVAEGNASDRLDRWLAAQIPALSRGRVQALIKDGHVTQAGRTIVEPNTRVKPAEVYEIVVPEAVPTIS